MEIEILSSVAVQQRPGIPQDQCLAGCLADIHIGLIVNAAVGLEVN
jgi:hypothetical protein